MYDFRNNNRSCNSVILTHQLSELKVTTKWILRTDK